MSLSLQRPLHALACGAALSVIAATSAFAAERPATDQPRYEEGKVESTAESRIAAVAPNARLAGLIRRDVSILRNKNIESVSRIATGVYCIKPTAGSGVKPNNSIVVATVDFYNSRFNESTVQWASQGSGCGNGRIGVYTLADENLDGVYTRSNTVGFSIYIP